VLAESNKTETALRVPELHLGVFAASGDELTIRGVSNAGHFAAVSLLLHYVLLALPLPNQKLANLSGGQCDPVTSAVEESRRNRIVGNAQRMNHVDVGQFVEVESSGTEGYHQNLGTSVVVCRGQLYIPLLFSRLIGQVMTSYFFVKEGVTLRLVLIFYMVDIFGFLGRFLLQRILFHYIFNVIF